MTEHFKPADSRWTNGNAVYRSDGRGTLFRVGAPGALVDGSKEAAKLVPYVDPGQRLAEDTAKERASRSPGIADVTRLIEQAKPLADLLGGQEPAAWVLLVLNGADPIAYHVKWGDKNSIAELKTTWAAIEEVEAKLKALHTRSYEAMKTPDDTCSDEARVEYERITATGMALGMDKMSLFVLWGAVNTSVGESDWSAERLARYEAKVKEAIASRAPKREASQSEQSDAHAVTSTSPIAEASPPPVADAKVCPVCDQEFQFSANCEEFLGTKPPWKEYTHGLGKVCSTEQKEPTPIESTASEHTEPLAHVPQDSNRWWWSDWLAKQDLDYQEFFLSLDDEGRQEELRLNNQLDPKLTDAPSAEPTAAPTSVAAAHATDASGTAGAHECTLEQVADCEDGYQIVRCAECGTYQEMVVNTETGEVAWEPVNQLEQLGFLVGDRDVTTINDHSVAQFIACKIDDLQHRIDRRIARFLEKIEPELNAHARLMRYYGRLFCLYGEQNLDTWKTDSKPESKSQHKAGDYKSKSIKFEDGPTLHFSEKGGYFVAESAKVRAHILKELNVAHLDELIPPEIKEKYGINLSLQFSNPKVFAVAEQEPIEGLGKTAVQEIGKVRIGSADAAPRTRGWNFDNWAKRIRAVIKPFASKALQIPGAQLPGIEQDDDEDDDAA